jgi:hypothetical protein
MLRIQKKNVNNYVLKLNIIFRLGKGIAKIFREKFGRIAELEASGSQVGEIAVLKDGPRFIYNLVTKVREQT